MWRFLLSGVSIALLAAACGSSQEPIPSLLDRETCWVEEELQVDAGVAYVVDPLTGSRFRDGDQALLEVGWQGQYHVNVSAEVVGDLDLTSGDVETAPRTHFSLRDEDGKLVATTLCAFRWAYESGGEEGLVLERPEVLIVSPAYYDRLVGHSATLSVRTLDVYGRVATGQVELSIYAEE